MKIECSSCPVARKWPYCRRGEASLYKDVRLCLKGASPARDKLHDSMLSCINARSGYLSLLCWKRACSGDLLEWASSSIKEGKFKGVTAGHVAVFHRDYVLYIAGVPKCGPSLRRLVEMTSLLYEACSEKAVELARERRRSVLRRLRSAVDAVVCTHRMWRVLDRAARPNFAADMEAARAALFTGTLEAVLQR